jgi:actin-related protein 8
MKLSDGTVVAAPRFQRTRFGGRLALPSVPAQLQYAMKRTKSARAQIIAQMVKRRVTAAESNVVDDIAVHAPVFKARNETTTTIPDADNKTSPAWTDVAHKPAYVCGPGALHIDPAEPYRIVYPVRRGHLVTDGLPHRLNWVGSPSASKLSPTQRTHAELVQALATNCSSTSSMTAVIDLLETLLIEAINETLKITRIMLKDYVIAFALPDTFTSREQKAVCTVLFDRLQVERIVLHYESVVTCFGSGVSSGCVVDIGAQKTRICCIDEGEIVPNSTVSLQYGGDDFTVLMTQMLQADKDHFFPFDEVSLCDTQHWLVLDQVKRDFCYYVLTPQYKVGVCDLTVRGSGGAPSTLHRFNISTVAVLTTLALFDPELLQPPVVSPAYAAEHARRNGSVDAYDPNGRFLRDSSFYVYSAEYLTMAPADRPTDLMYAGIRMPPIPIIPLSHPSWQVSYAQHSQNSTGGGSGGGEDPGDASPSAAAAAAAAAVKSEPKSKAAQVSGSKRPHSATVVGSSRVEENKIKKRKLAAASAAATAAAAADKKKKIKTKASSKTLSRQLHTHRQAIHLAIIKSIKALCTPELQQKMATRIVLAGGCANVPGLTEILEDNLIQTLPSSVNSIDTVNVLRRKNTVAREHFVWRGMAVVGQIPNSAELWIPRSEWRARGIAVLREHAPWPALSD